MQRLQTIEHDPGVTPSLTVIWLHGLGADGHDFEPLVPELALSTPVRFVFPHAPVRPVTINGGLRMRAWYDILGLHPGAPQDAAGIRESAALVGALIDAEIARGTPSARLVLAGFSQGGAIALHTGLRESRRLAGVLALSTYLPLADTVAEERSAANAGLEIMMAHGLDDPVIPLGMGEASRDALRALGYEVQWFAYPMGHSVCPQEVGDIRAWLEARARAAA
ncbi:MAG TPA: carboxylesterase [Gammaproteobacteria bacterium]